MITAMDSLEKYRVMPNCFGKTFAYHVEDKVDRIVKRIKHVSMRHISAMQLKICLRKGCKINAIQITDPLLSENKTSIDDHVVLIEFLYVFPQEILELTPQQEIDFLIDLIHVSALVSKIPIE